MEGGRGNGERKQHGTWTRAVSSSCSRFHLSLKPSRRPHLKVSLPFTRGNAPSRNAPSPLRIPPSRSASSHLRPTAASKC